MAFLSLGDQMGRVQIAVSHVIQACGRNTDDFVSIGVLKNVFTVIRLGTAVQKPNASVAVIYVGPSVTFSAITVAGAQVKIGILLNVVAFPSWVEVIDFHTPTATAP